ncbi:hypothetical protein BD779DRAFT_1538909, partial [Infundibulicybe gibba]
TRTWALLGSLICLGYSVRSCYVRRTGPIFLRVILEGLIRRLTARDSRERDHGIPILYQGHIGGDNLISWASIKAGQWYARCIISWLIVIRLGWCV